MTPEPEKELRETVERMKRHYAENDRQRDAARAQAERLREAVEPVEAELRKHADMLVSLGDNGTASAFLNPANTLAQALAPEPGQSASADPESPQEPKATGFQGEQGGEGDKCSDCRTKYSPTCNRRGHNASREVDWEVQAKSLRQEIRETLRVRGYWAPVSQASLITAVGKALDKSAPPGPRELLVTCGEQFGDIVCVLVAGHDGPHNADNPPPSPSPEAGEEHGPGECKKAVHNGEGYLHGRNYDGPFDVDGVAYCGRCHVFMSQPAGESAARKDGESPNRQEEGE